jgi:uncharacterized protein YndB with AHSA1/START domain
MRPALSRLPLLLLPLVALASPRATHAGEGESPPLSTVGWIDAPVDAVWEAFTTAEGWKQFGIAQVEMDFRVGGRIRTHYDPKGTLGDEKTIENTILAYEPLRMLSIKATKAPVGIPFPADVLEKTWSVFSLTDLGDGRTRVVIRGHGYGEDEGSKKARSFFDQGNARSLQRLSERLGRKRSAEEMALAPIELGAVVRATPEAAFEAWTTSAGLKAFLGVESVVRLEPGGPFELHFAPKAPEGKRGSEGCQVLTWIPSRLLSFSWNAPPLFPRAREARTRVVLEFEREDAAHTRVWLTHTGFREAAAKDAETLEEWKKVRAYFEKAWPQVLGALTTHFAGK